MDVIKVGVLSDTHGSFPEQLYSFFAGIDEIWHCGDIGSIGVAETLRAFKPLRAVHGNIDDQIIRLNYPSFQVFDCAGARILLTHIGGYPGRYDPQALKLIRAHQPEIFACGHSHILKVQFDPGHSLLHINPGAAGKSGFHTHITMIRLEIIKRRAQNLEVFDLPRKQ